MLYAATLFKLRVGSGLWSGYIDVYCRYAWPVNGVDDFRVAPFHVLAGHGGVFTDRKRGRHLELSEQLVTAAPDFIKRTDRHAVDMTDAESEQSACARWEGTTAAGREAMVMSRWAP